MCDYFLDKVGYLQTLCNRFGDLKICHTYIKDGQMYWSKHRSVLWCWSDPSRFKYLEKATHRQILKPEIVFDVDRDVRRTISKIIKLLKHYSWDYKIFFSGNKGFHTHCIIPDMIQYDVTQRERFRELIFNRVGCDLMKKCERSMIALEGTPHRKTGKKKLEVTIPNVKRY